MGRIFIKVEDDCVAPVILEKDHAMVYLQELLDGRSLNEPIKISKVELTQKEYDKLPEFEG